MQRSETGRAPLSLVPGTRGPADEPGADRVELLATAVGADDLLVLRQVSPGRFLHLGGAGRGAGWAGSFEVRAEAEPSLRAALDGRRVLRWDGGAAQQVLGPYHARCAALVPVDHDRAVLLGGDRPLAEEGQLVEAARAAVALVEGVSPAKRLADELEVLSALRTVLHLPPAGVRSTLEHVTRSAAEALSCEVAVGWLPGHEEVVVVERGWSLGVRPAALVDALHVLRERGRSCAQDSAADPLPAPLGPQAGVRSSLVLPLGAPADGLLVLLHTAARPRGFTGLCQVVGERVAEAGGVVVQASVVRADLEEQVRVAQAAARRDPLTALDNRRGWDEALVRAEDDDPRGERPLALLVVDLNGLKAVNDTRGHSAGDEFLRRTASAVRSSARRGDVVARLGGDEFGLLLHGADHVAAQAVVDRVRAAVAADGGGLSAAVGVAVRRPGERLAELWCRADRSMYDDKSGG